MATPAPLLEAVGQIAVRVHDLPRAKAFYRDVLGLKLAIEAPGLLFFEIGGLRVQLSRVPTSCVTGWFGVALMWQVAQVGAAV